MEKPLRSTPNRLGHGEDPGPHVRGREHGEMDQALDDIVLRVARAGVTDAGARETGRWCVAVAWRALT